MDRTVYVPEEDDKTILYTDSFGGSTSNLLDRSYWGAAFRATGLSIQDETVVGAIGNRTRKANLAATLAAQGVDPNTPAAMYIEQADKETLKNLEFMIGAPIKDALASVDDPNTATLADLNAGAAVYNLRQELQEAHEEIGSIAGFVTSLAGGVLGDAPNPLNYLPYAGWAAKINSTLRLAKRAGTATAAGKAAQKMGEARKAAQRYSTYRGQLGSFALYTTPRIFAENVISEAGLEVLDPGARNYWTNIMFGTALGSTVFAGLPAIYKARGLKNRSQQIVNSISPDVVKQLNRLEATATQAKEASEKVNAATRASTENAAAETKVVPANAGKMEQAKAAEASAKAVTEQGLSEGSQAAREGISEAKRATGSDDPVVAQESSEALAENARENPDLVETAPDTTVDAPTLPELEAEILEEIAGYVGRDKAEVLTALNARGSELEALAKALGAWRRVEPGSPGKTKLLRLYIQEKDAVVKDLQDNPQAFEVETEPRDVRAADAKSPETVAVALLERTRSEAATNAKAKKKAETKADLKDGILGWMSRVAWERGGRSNLDNPGEKVARHAERRGPIYSIASNRELSERFESYIYEDNLSVDKALLKLADDNETTANLIAQVSELTAQRDSLVETVRVVDPKKGKGGEVVENTKILDRVLYEQLNEEIEATNRQFRDELTQSMFTQDELLTEKGVGVLTGLYKIMGDENHPQRLAAKQHFDSMLKSLNDNITVELANRFIPGFLNIVPNASFKNWTMNKKGAGEVNFPPIAFEYREDLNAVVAVVQWGRKSDNRADTDLAFDEAKFEENLRGWLENNFESLGTLSSKDLGSIKRKAKLSGDQLREVNEFIRTQTKTAVKRVEYISRISEQYQKELKAKGNPERLAAMKKIMEKQIKEHDDAIASLHEMVGGTRDAGMSTYTLESVYRNASLAEKRFGPQMGYARRLTDKVTKVEQMLNSAIVDDTARVIDPETTRTLDGVVLSVKRGSRSSLEAMRAASDHNEGLNTLLAEAKTAEEIADVQDALAGAAAEKKAAILVNDEVSAMLEPSGDKTDPLSTFRDLDKAPDGVDPDVRWEKLDRVARDLLDRGIITQELYNDLFVRWDAEVEARLSGEQQLFRAIEGRSPAQMDAIDSILRMMSVVTPEFRAVLHKVRYSGADLPEGIEGKFVGGLNPLAVKASNTIDELLDQARQSRFQHGNEVVMGRSATPTGVFHEMMHAVFPFTVNRRDLRPVYRHMKAIQTSDHFTNYFEFYRKGDAKRSQTMKLLKDPNAEARWDNLTEQGKLKYAEEILVDEVAKGLARNDPIVREGVLGKMLGILQWVFMPKSQKNIRRVVHRINRRIRESGVEALQVQRHVTEAQLQVAYDFNNTLVMNDIDYQLPGARERVQEWLEYLEQYRPALYAAMARAGSTKRNPNLVDLGDLEAASRLVTDDSYKLLLDLGSKLGMRGGKKLTYTPSKKQLDNLAKESQDPDPTMGVDLMGTTVSHAMQGTAILENSMTVAGKLLSSVDELNRQGALSPDDATFVLSLFETSGIMARDVKAEVTANNSLSTKMSRIDSQTQTVRHTVNEAMRIYAMRKGGTTAKDNIKHKMTGRSYINDPKVLEDFQVEVVTAMATGSRDNLDPEVLTAVNSIYNYMARAITVMDQVGMISKKDLPKTDAGIIQYYPMNMSRDTLIEFPDEWQKIRVEELLAAHTDKDPAIKKIKDGQSLQAAAKTQAGREWLALKNRGAQETPYMGRTSKRKVGKGRTGSRTIQYYDYNKWARSKFLKTDLDDMLFTYSRSWYLEAEANRHFSAQGVDNWAEAYAYSKTNGYEKMLSIEGIDSLRVYLEQAQRDIAILPDGAPKKDAFASPEEYKAYQWAEKAMERYEVGEGKFLSYIQIASKLMRDNVADRARSKVGAGAADYVKKVEAANDKVAEMLNGYFSLLRGTVDVGTKSELGIMGERIFSNLSSASLGLLPVSFMLELPHRLLSPFKDGGRHMAKNLRGVLEANSDMKPDEIEAMMALGTHLAESRPRGIGEVEEISAASVRDDWAQGNAFQRAVAWFERKTDAAAATTYRWSGAVTLENHMRRAAAFTFIRSVVKKLDALEDIALRLKANDIDLDSLAKKHGVDVRQLIRLKKMGLTPELVSSLRKYRSGDYVNVARMSEDMRAGDEAALDALDFIENGAEFMANTLVTRPTAENRLFGAERSSLRRFFEILTGFSRAYMTKSGGYIKGSSKPEFIMYAALQLAIATAVTALREVLRGERDKLMEDLTTPSGIQDLMVRSIARTNFLAPMLGGMIGGLLMGYGFDMQPAGVSVGARMLTAPKEVVDIFGVMLDPEQDIMSDEGFTSLRNLLKTMPILNLPYISGPVSEVLQQVREDD